MAIHTFPRYVVFRSHPSLGATRPNKYLKYVSEGVAGARHSYIQLDADEAVTTPYTKFELEAASTTRVHDNNNLYHIKSCYNNKYLARVSNSAEPDWLAACADAPDEDLTKWTCTLFRLVSSSWDLYLVELRHPLSYRVVAHHDQPALQPHGTFCLHFLERTSNRVDVWFRITDWDSLCIFPDRVAFKAVDKERYVSAKVVRGQNHLELSATEKADITVSSQAFSNPDGSVRILSDSFNRFWYCNPVGINRWVLANADQSKATGFHPVRVGHDTVAIRCLEADGQFLMGKTGDGKTDCLYAESASPDRRTILKVEEPVLGRSIYNVSYRLSEASIYDEEPVVMVSADASNGSTEDETLSFTLSYTTETSRSLNHSVSVGAGVETNIQTGFLKIFEGKIQVSASASYNHTWGKTTTTSQTETETLEVPVPAGTRVKVRILATKGSYNVPFSYTQRDTLPSTSRPDIKIKHDGLYIGANSYTVRSESTEEPLELIQ